MSENNELTQKLSKGIEPSPTESSSEAGTAPSETSISTGIKSTPPTTEKSGSPSTPAGSGVSNSVSIWRAGEKSSAEKDKLATQGMEDLSLTTENLLNSLRKESNFVKRLHLTLSRTLSADQMRAVLVDAMASNGLDPIQEYVSSVKEIVQPEKRHKALQGLLQMLGVTPQQLTDIGERRINSALGNAKGVTVNVIKFGDVNPSALKAKEVSDEGRDYSSADYSEFQRAAEQNLDTTLVQEEMARKAKRVIPIQSSPVVETEAKIIEQRVEGYGDTVT